MPKEASTSQKPHAGEREKAGIELLNAALNVPMRPSQRLLHLTDNLARFRQ